MTYTKPIKAQQDQPGATGPAHPTATPTYLSTKIFLPYKKSDTMSDIKQRLSDWVNQYLGNYETVFIFCLHK